MQLEKQELYQEIVRIISTRAKKANTSPVMIANELNIPQSTWYFIRQYARKGGSQNILSPVRLKKVCLSVGIVIRKEIFDVENKNKILY